MRITIFGMGAVGGHLCARLAASGHDVSVVARGATLDAVKRDGVSLQLGDEVIQANVTATDNAMELGRQDLVISTVKATDPSGLAAGLAPLLRPDTSVVFAQNGIPWWYPMGLSEDRPKPPALGFLDPDGALSRTVARDQVIGAVIQSSNEMVSPGVVRAGRAKNNTLLIGEPDDADSQRITELRALLNAAGINSPHVPDIRQAIWRKLLTNISVSIMCMLTGRRATMFGEDKRMADLYRRVAAEGVSIAAAHGLDLSAFDPEVMLSNPSDHMPSIGQDFALGRKLELDTILIAAHAFARAANLATPHLDTLVALAVRKGADNGLYVDRNAGL